MGVLFSVDNPQSRYASFDNGIIHSGAGTSVLGHYNEQKVLDANGHYLATLSGPHLFPAADTEPALHAEKGVVYRDEQPVARYQGHVSGACAAAYLYLKAQSATNYDLAPESIPPKNDDSEKTECWTFDELMANIKVQCTPLVLVLLIAAAAGIIYTVVQFPRNIAYLLEAGGSPGIGMLCIWGGAFIFSFVRCTYPAIRDFRDIAVVLWKNFVPYLHASWIFLIVSCMYASIEGFLSLSYISGMLSLLPEVVLLLSIPLWLLQLIRSLYLLYKVNPL